MKAHALLSLALISSAFAQEPSIEKLDPALDALIAPDTKIEVIAQGFRWTEGPAWNAATGEFLFSDIPNNVINAWHPEKGIGVDETVRLHRHLRLREGSWIQWPDLR